MLKLGRYVGKTISKPVASYTRHVTLNRACSNSYLTIHIAVRADFLVGNRKSSE